MVTTGRASPALLRRVAERIAHPALPCPARGLEFVVYRRRSVGESDAPPVYDLDLNTGPAMAPRMSMDPAGEPGHWYPIDIAIGRAHAVALTGPPPQEVFAARPAALVRGALEVSLAWHEAHERDGANAVLNACRAWRWAKEGVWSAKTAAAQWSLERLDDPAPVHAALAARHGERRPAPAAETIRRARAALAGSSALHS